VAIRVTAPRPPVGGASELVAEAVNDHIRVISSTHPVDIESGGIHQVKPWFTGRLDFAPRVGFSGDDDFPLVGGSVGYFRDRKAAVFVFKRRLHTITLLVFPPEGLTWPTNGLSRVGRLSVSETNARGFSVLTWRDGGLGYALVSDVNVRDLEALAVRLNGD
jgi:anti-sigma factor RsiW